MKKIMNWLGSLRWLHIRIYRSVATISAFYRKKPFYLLPTTVISIIFYQFVFWLLNVELALYLFSSQFLSIVDKVELLFGSYSGIFSPPYSGFSIMLFTVSLLQGVAISCLIYIAKTQRQKNTQFIKNFGGTGIAGIFAVIGIGCAACGTSLIVPILSVFFASSAVALAETIGVFAIKLALVASIITVHLTGLKLVNSLNQK